MANHGLKMPNWNVERRFGGELAPVYHYCITCLNFAELRRFKKLTPFPNVSNMIWPSQNTNIVQWIL